MIIGARTGAWAKRGCQSSFVGVEYITLGLLNNSTEPESNGYIELPYLITPTTVVECIARRPSWMTDSDNGFATIFQTYPMREVEYSRPGIGFRFGRYNKGKAVFSYSNGITNSLTFTSGYQEFRTFTYDSSGIFNVEGIGTKDFSVERNPLYDSKFIIGTSPDGSTRRAVSPIDISSYKISDDTGAIFDFEPCRNQSNEPFLHDLISGEYYGLTGGYGSVGPDVA